MTLLSYFFGIVMILAGIMHIANPSAYAGLIPQPIPESLAHGFALLTEAAIGICLLIPKTRAMAWLAFSVLMIVFMPIHILDALKPTPFVGSHINAYIRLVIQVGLILMGVIFWRKQRSTPT